MAMACRTNTVLATFVVMCITGLDRKPRATMNDQQEEFDISGVKIAIVDDLNETVKTLAISGIKQRHPNATPEQVQRMLAELMLGVELAQKVYDHAR